VDWVGEEGEHSFTLCNLVDLPGSLRMDIEKKNIFLQKQGVFHGDYGE
jgi:hypothetical protein